MKLGQFKDNQDIKNQFEQTGEVFERTPIQAEGLPETTRKTWRFVIAALLLVTLLCAATYLIGG